MTRAACALAAAALAASACGPKAPPGADAEKAPKASGPIAVTSRMDGSISIVEREGLAVRRTFPAGAPSPWPMLALADPARQAFYVGNVKGALARIPFDEGESRTLDLGAPLAGLALSPDGKLLAAAGVKDLVLRLVDPVAWKEVARVPLGNAADAPKQKLAFGVASPHPVWLGDGSGVVVQDNVHEELLLVSRAGKVTARRAMRSAVHDVLVAGDGTLLALAEGTPGSVRAHIAVYSPRLEPVREIDLPLPEAESPKLHHGALSPDGELVVVANMGPIAGEPGVTAAAVRWRTGEVAWTAPSVRTAGHVAFLDPTRVLVSGHRTAEMKVLDAASGKELETWEVMGTPALGHALEPQADGSVLVLDGTLGRILRFKGGELIGESERVGDGYAESSLSE